MFILDQIHWVPGLVPTADYAAGGVSSDIVECRSAAGVLIIIERGDSTGGTATGVVTVQACDDVTPTTTANVPFHYRSMTTTDTWGAWTLVANTGFTMPTGDNQMHQIWVSGAELAANGYGYVRVSITEPVNDPVVGSILIGVVQTRYQRDTTTMIT